MGVNLSKEERVERINLRKQEVSDICLDKPNLVGLKSRTAVVLDFSWSMDTLYRNGTVQEAVEKFLPLALNFDDNGEMEFWIFDNGFHRLENLTLDNFHGYVDKYILSNYNMGGTQFAPVMCDIKSRYVIEEPQNLPNYVIFITDGENSDTTRTTELIQELSHYPIFFQFVGIGNCSFNYLQSLGDMTGRYVDNADFFSISDMDSITYEQLLNEYPQWLCEQKVKDMIAEQGTPEVLERARAVSGAVSEYVMSTGNTDTTPKKKGLFSKLFGK